MTSFPTLAPWAQRAEEGRGRRYDEAEHPYRPPYARDRDRVIHCRAFRRLEYKTQVFVNHEGDHYRTRLTHSIEVAQIARTVARALCLNLDLVETLALCHDLGHTPFGHLGEEVLDPLMREHGGFDHNRQTLRIVEVLERRYPAFPGLNLTWEVREGIVKHSGPPDPRRAPEAVPYDPELPPPLEAQLIDLVDEIAYNHHDVEDGLESGLLDLDDLCRGVPLFGAAIEAAGAAWPEHSRRMWTKIALRRVIDRLVTDLVDHTREQIVARDVRSVADIRAAGEWLVGLPPETAGENARLKRHLRDRLYRHERIEKTRRHFESVLRELFAVYSSGKEALPESFAARRSGDDLHQVACDYVAGMTDRFALQEHRRLCGGPGPDVTPAATR